MSKSLFLTAVVAGLLGYLAGHLPLTDRTAARSGENATALEPVAAGSAVSHYVCPMHAEIVREAPGSCPICGMDLVKQTPLESADTEDGMPAVTIAPSVEHNLAVRTAKAGYGDLQRSIETIGKITRVDPMARRTLTPPIGGELVEIADKHDGDSHCRKLNLAGHAIDQIRIHCAHRRAADKQNPGEDQQQSHAE